MSLQIRDVGKYPPTSALLASSARLVWPTLSVELRSRGGCESAGIFPQNVEICLVIDGNSDGLARRTDVESSQESMPKTGAIWLSSGGLGKAIAITSPIPQTLHLYLPTTLLSRLQDDFNLPITPGHSIRYVAGINDEVIQHIGSSIFAELANETAVGRMYVETAALTLGARLLQKYCDSGACLPTESSVQALDRIRLCRVLDYIAASIEGDITLEDLAGIAGYSIFHFARKFTLAMGVSPNRYISGLRLKNAMAELAAGKLPIAQIALNAHFSSQASFTRAFHRATNMTPKEYRRNRL